MIEGDLLSIDEIKNIEAETSLLNVCLSNFHNDNSAFAQIEQFLDVEDFYGIANQSVYKAISEVFANGDSINMPSVADYMDKHGLMDKIGNPIYLTQLCGGLAYPNQVKLYASQIKECSIRRKLVLMTEQIIKDMHDRTVDVPEALAGYLDAIEDLKSNETAEKDNSIEDAFKSFLSSEEEGIKYGIQPLDRILKGMRPGHFIVLAGRPAMGKTALALNIVRNVCSHHYKVLYFSLEMIKVDLYKRLIACEIGMSEEEAKTKKANYIAHGKNDEAEKIQKKVEAGKNRVASWQLEIVADMYTLGDIRAKTKLIAKKGIDLVVIDHLQLMSASGYKDNRVGEMTEITRSLVNLAKDINAPVLCLSQINRQNEKNSNKRPLLSDLKESGSIEQDADQVMMIYRDKYYDKNGDDWTEVIVRKNRHGGVGTARLSYDMARNQFTDYKGISGEKVKRSDAKDVREFFDEG